MLPADCRLLYLAGSDQLDSKEPTLLITPESMLLSHGGSVQFLPGILNTSIYSPPEIQSTTKIIDPEKVIANSIFSINLMIVNFLVLHLCTWYELALCHEI